MIYALVGALVGSGVGKWLSAYWAPLGHSYVTFGVTQPWTLNLSVVGVTAGAWVALNLLGMVGIIVGVVLWARA